MKKLYSTPQFALFNEIKVKKRWKRKKRTKKRNINHFHCNFIRKPEEYEFLVPNCIDRLTIAHITSELRNIVEDQNRETVTFNFRDAEKVSISGGILLKYFYDYIFSYSNKKFKVKGVSQENRKKIYQIISHIGLLGENVKESTKITYDDIIRWEIQSWRKNEKYDQQKISELISRVRNKNESESGHSEIYSSILELLNNCKEHAYAYNTSGEFDKFYLFSGIDKESSEIVFLVFDAGCGFKTSYLKQGKRKSISIKGDKGFILDSFKESVSSTREKGRGNGLAYVREKIFALKGDIDIYSYKGIVSFINEKKSESKTAKEKLAGTLIRISVPY